MTDDGKEGNVGRRWNIGLDELTLNTYPDLTPKHLYMNKGIIQTIWDIDFSTAPCNLQSRCTRLVPQIQSEQMFYVSFYEELFQLFRHIVQLM
jgi:hypothetical protein